MFLQLISSFDLSHKQRLYTHEETVHAINRLKTMNFD